MGSAKKLHLSDEDMMFTCCWCQLKTEEVRVFNGLYYHPGECLSAAVLRKRLLDAEKEFEEAPDEGKE